MNRIEAGLNTLSSQTDGFGFVRHYNWVVGCYYFSVPKNESGELWLLSKTYSSKESMEKGILSAIQLMSRVSYYSILEKEERFYFQLREGQKLIAESAPMESASSVIVELGKFIYWAECQNELYRSFFSVRTFEAA